MQAFYKNIQKALGQVGAQLNDPGAMALASKYGIPFDGSAFDAGCPGIMNPLGETPRIELSWGSGYHNADKSMRFTQFSTALKILDEYTEGNNLVNLANRFVGELNVHGRAMFSNIVLHLQGEYEQLSAPILSVVEPRKAEGLNMAEIPFGKGGVTVQQIFDKYIEPKLAPFHIDVLVSAAQEVYSAAAANLKDDSEDDSETDDVCFTQPGAKPSGSHDSTMGNVGYPPTEDSQGDL